MIFSSVSSSEEELEHGKPNEGEELPKGSTTCLTSDVDHLCLYWLSNTDLFTGIDEASESEEEEMKDEEEEEGKTLGPLERKKKKGNSL